MNHICKEASIPISWGTLGGKLWTPKTPSPNEEKSGALCLHGWHDNAASFDRLIQYFPPDMTVLALDLPGHGHSDHYNDKVAYHFAAFVSDVLEVLNYLAWKRPILIGHSFGGLLANVVAATLQNGIGKLILIEALFSDKYEILDKIFFDHTQHKYDTQSRLHNNRLYSSKKDVAEAILRGNQGLDSISSAQILATRGCKEVDGGFVLTRDKRMEILTITYVRTIYWAYLSQMFYDRLAMPTLCINGNKSNYKPEEWTKRDIVRLSPSSRMKTVEGGHMVHMNSPGQVGKVMGEFISQRYTSKL